MAVSLEEPKQATGEIESEIKSLIYIINNDNLRNIISRLLIKIKPVLNENLKKENPPEEVRRLNTSLGKELYEINKVLAKFLDDLNDLIDIIDL